MSAGFYKRRRGIVDHIESGAIDLLESGIHDYLLLKANLVIGSKFPLPPGVCMTSAPAIHACCRRVSERTIQRCLSHLEELDFIKTWKTAGKRGNFPVLVCRASVHDLSGNEYRINGAKTADWHNPVFEPVANVSGSSRGGVEEVSAYREVENLKTRKEKNPAAKTTPPGDPRHKQVFESCYESYRGHHGAPPTWGGKEAKALARFLKENTSQAATEIARRYRNLLASTDRYHGREKHGSLCHLLQNFDTFADGPILAIPTKGNGNGNSTIGDRIRATIEAQREKPPA